MKRRKTKKTTEATGESSLIQHRGSKQGNASKLVCEDPLVPADSDAGMTAPKLPPAPSDPATAWPGEENAATQRPDPEDHPLASAFPLMADEDLDLLAEDIRAHGLQEPGTLYEGKILDGRCRTRACRRAGVPMRYRDLAPGVDPVAFVVSRNFLRREIHDKGQRAAIALALEGQYADEARERQLAGKGPDGSGGRGRRKAANLEEFVPRGSDKSAPQFPRTRQRIAALVGVSDRYVAMAKVIKRFKPELYEAVRLGKAKLAAAFREVKQSQTGHHSNQRPETPDGSPETDGVEIMKQESWLDEIDHRIEELRVSFHRAGSLVPQAQKQLRETLRTFCSRVSKLIDKAASQSRTEVTL